MTQPGEVRIARARCCRSPTRRGSSTSRAGSRSSASSSSPPAAPPRALREAGLEVRAIEDFTGFPEIMGGRVKTLHPKLYAGLLALRDDPEHMAAAERARGRVRRPRVREPLSVRGHGGAAAASTEHEVIENIDIGGPTMIRAAAKNFALLRGRRQARRATTRCCRSSRDAGGKLSLGTRESLAAEAFSYTARYDTRDLALVRREAGRLPAAACSTPTRRSPTSPTARTRTSAPPTTARSARACTCSRWSASSAARSCRSTTCSTSTPARLLRRRVRAAGLRDHQAQQPVRRARSAARRSRPTSAPSRATRCRPSAA